MTSRSVYLLADRLFDGEQVRHDLAIGIVDERIARIIPASDVPADCEIQRLDGCTLTPGLIDAHVHMTPWMVYGLLAAGVTTVRDVGNDIDAIAPELDRIPEALRPRVLWSGPLLESDRVNWPSIGMAHRSTAEIRATVDELASRGLHTIKLYANATPELMAAAADQAHRHGMRVLGHLGATNFFEAVAAGVDELQHLAGCLSTDLGLRDREAAVDLLASAPIDHCPTLVVWDALAHLGEPRRERDKAIAWVPPAIRVAWSRAYHATQPSPERLRRLNELLERMAAIAGLRRAGTQVLVGSDSPFAGLVPGFALHDEAGLLVESGLSSLEVMRCLTAGNAAALRLNDVGVVAEGARADLVAFEGDPTQRIADLSTVRMVWRGGTPSSPCTLASAAVASFGGEPTSPVDQIAAQRYIPATADWPSQS